MITKYGRCLSYTESCKYSDTWEQTLQRFVLGNQTFDSYKTVHDIMTICSVPRVNITGKFMTKYI